MNESDSRELAGERGAGMGEDARRVVGYLVAPESDEYVAVMTVLERSVTEMAPTEVNAQLRADGWDLDQVVVEARLDKLCSWGAVSPRADTSHVQRYTDLLARNRRYIATGLGRNVHRFYDQFLAGAPAMREIPLPSLNRVVALLEELARLLTGSGPHSSSHRATRDPGQLADKVGQVFVSHDDLDRALVGAEDGLAALMDRFDLDDTKTAELKSLLVEYATHVATELDRGAARAHAALRALGPHVDRLAQAAVATSDARDLIASGALTASRGGRVEDWTGLVRWFDPTTGRASRFSARLIQALPGMHANLRRLHTSAGTATTRARALAMAKACTDPELGTQVWQAALGDHAWRKLCGTAEDEEQTRAVTSWRDGPAVTVPELLRTTGRTGARGRAAAARDDTATRAAISSRRAERQRRHAEALNEILTSAPGDLLTDHAARVAFAALAGAARAGLRADAAGLGLPGRVGSRDGLGCTLLYLGPAPAGLIRGPAHVGILRAPTWRVLLPGRLAVFHPPGQIPQLPAVLAAAVRPDPRPGPVLVRVSEVVA